MNRWQDVVSDLQSSGLPDPGERSLDHPANRSQATAVRGPWLSQVILDPTILQTLAVTWCSVGPISVGALGSSPSASASLSDEWDVIQQRQRFEGIVTLSTGDPHRQRRAATIDQQVAFRAFFCSIRGVLAGQYPPKTARMLWLSTITLDQSIRPSRPSRCNSVWRSRFQTPRRCQSRKRRQQVTPEPHPISCGSIHQGIPLWRTKTMPVKQARSSTGGRPRLPGLALCRGNRGWMTAQSSSDTRGRAITHLRTNYGGRCHSIPHHF